MFCCCWTECASIGLDPCQLVMSSPMSLLILSLVPGSTECEGRGDHVLTIAVELYFFFLSVYFLLHTCEPFMFGSQDSYHLLMDYLLFNNIPLCPQ